MSDSIILAYWGIRGRAQPLRYLLAYSGLNFDEKIYTDFQQYFGEKNSLGISFPNLPYLIDGDTRVSETLAVAHHIARKSSKHNLLGKNAQQEAVIDNIFYSFWEGMIGQLIQLMREKKVEDLKTPYYYKNKGKYEKFEKFLGGKNFALGEISIVDFFISEGSYYIERLFPEEYTKFQNIHKIRQNIQALPEVMNYLKRDKKVFTPFLPPSLTPVPFFYPGTEPNVPPPTLSPNKSSIKSQKEEEKIRLVIISGSDKGNNETNLFLKGVTKIHNFIEAIPTDISTLEIYQEQLEKEGTPKVNDLRKQIEGANGVLFGVTETHGNVSPALINAFNWISGSLKNKKVALASLGHSQNRFQETLNREGVSYLKGADLKVEDKNFIDHQGNVQGQQNIKKVNNYFSELKNFFSKA